MKNSYIQLTGQVFMAVAAALALSSCGGGGGSTAAPVAKAPTSLTEVTVPTGFDWGMAQSSSVALTLARSNGAALGTGVKVLLSNYSCSHPSLGSLTNPIATDLIASYSLTSAEGESHSAVVRMDGLPLPATTTSVLIEVVEANATLYSRRQAVTALGNLSLTFKDVPPSSDLPADSAYLDACN